MKNMGLKSFYWEKAKIFSKVWPYICFISRFKNGKYVSGFHLILMSKVMLKKASRSRYAQSQTRGQEPLFCQCMHKYAYEVNSLIKE